MCPVGVSSCSQANSEYQELGLLEKSNGPTFATSTPRTLTEQRFETRDFDTG
jgi:hypothetical protein